MKTTNLFLATLFLTGSLHAEFRTWTRADGKTAELELTATSGEGEAVKGVFKMKNGRSVDIAAADLAEADAELVKNWQPAPSEPEAASGPSSVFDDVLDGNLVVIDGKEFKNHEAASKPTEYYVFYYTASWCPPCQAFTPELVSFYKKNKNDKFEIVLVTSDRDEASMAKYATDKKMPWPQLKHSEAGTFKSKFNHGVSGIPAVIVCDLKGEIVSRNGRNLAELKKIVK
jgi:thiol-disulfide isomerase/thioredoxin